MVGESLQLNATVLPVTKIVQWRSSNASVANVDVSTGMVNAVAPGEAVITAKCDNLTATCTIKVLPIPVESITLSQLTAELKVGKSVILSATVLPENTTDKTVTWSSSNETVAKVDANGNVTAVAVGEAVITARCGSVSATCTITVVPTPVESITISQSTATLKTAETVQLTATVLPETATDKRIVWTTSDATVATVSEAGLVTAIKVGKTTITATASSGIKAECVITVEATPAESITLSQTIAQLKVGESITLVATVLPTSTTNKTVTWTSSNEAVATVDGNGNVTAKALGEADIKVVCGQMSAICKIEVIPTPVEIIKLSPVSAQLRLGESITIIATVMPENATNKDVKWHSSDGSIISVDQNGKVTAVGYGNATVTVEALDDSHVKATATITVPENLNVTYDFGKPTELTPSQNVNTNNEPACDVNGVQFTNGPIVLMSSEGSTKPRLWYNASKGTQLRVYNGGNISISCDDSNEITKIEFTGQQLDALKVGSTAFPNNATVSYSSENGAKTIKFDCVTNGTHKRADISTITVTYRQKQVNVGVQEIYFPEKELTLRIGEERRIEVVVLPENATDKTITWTSSNEAVAKVDTEGKVTAVALGDAEITANCGGVSATCEVSVLPILIESITLTPDVWSGVEGDFIQLVTVVLPENATDKSLNWTSSDETVATVDNTGLVSIKTEGTCVITAMANDGSGVEAKCILTGRSGIEAVYTDCDRSVDVYSLGGQLLKKGCDKAHLQHLAPGMYILRNGSKVVKAIVK